MKYSLISDLHLDFAQNRVPYELLEENVIIAGDTSNGLECLKFFEKLRKKGFNVFTIDGNHEHYSNVNKGRTINQTTERFRENNPNVSSFDGVPIIGVNGWYQVSNGNNWFSSMNDGHFTIGGRDVELASAIMNNFCYDNYIFLRDKLENATEKHIVVTHTAPCVETLDPKYDGHYSNEYYYNRYMYDLLENYSDKIAIWNHGHTHAFADKEVKGVRVVCNPRGYPDENPSWKPFTIEI